MTGGRRRRTYVEEGRSPVVTRPPRTSWPCQAGSAKGKILYIAPDFDAPLDDFKEYME